MSREAGTHITLVEDADISVCPWGNQCNSLKSFFVEYCIKLFIYLDYRFKRFIIFIYLSQVLRIILTQCSVLCSFIVVHTGYKMIYEGGSYADFMDLPSPMSLHP